MIKSDIPCKGCICLASCKAKFKDTGAIHQLIFDNIIQECKLLLSYWLLQCSQGEGFNEMDEIFYFFKSS